MCMVVLGSLLDEQDTALFAGRMAATLSAGMSCRRWQGTLTERLGHWVPRWRERGQLRVLTVDQTVFELLRLLDQCCSLWVPHMQLPSEGCHFRLAPMKARCSHNGGARRPWPDRAAAPQCDRMGRFDAQHAASRRIPSVHDRVGSSAKCPNAKCPEIVPPRF